MNRRLLIVAYHFPPLQGSTGVHRTLAFAKYLRPLGWDVAVLTASPRAYPTIREENSSLIPPQVRVIRAWAFDAQRHFSLAGRYPSFLSIPDRWQSWIPFGIVAGLALVRRWVPSVILSTYPLASAHCIGLVLHRLTGIPWVGDFRDPMAQENYPKDPVQHRAFERIERSTFRHASRVIATTPGTAALYRERFPDYPPDAVTVIPNGFDEDLFAQVMMEERPRDSTPHRKLTLVHSGLLYPHERDPTALFQALSELASSGRLAEEDVQFVFRGSGNEREYERTLDDLRIGHLVKLLPSVPYHEALREMCEADALLILQAANCNLQIPAKAYEYLYTGKPILALTDPSGDTAELLRSVSIDSIVPLDDAGRIKAAVPQFLAALRSGTAPRPDRGRAISFSRRVSTEQLASLLEAVVHPAGTTMMKKCGCSG